MKNLIFLLILIPVLFAFMSSCEESVTEPEPPPPTAKAVYVLNSTATSISVIDLVEDEVFNNVATVGTWPNQLVYRKGKVYCVNSGSNNIMIFDADTWQSETPVDLGVGNNPMNMAFYDDNIAYVACLVSEKVLQVDMSSKTVTKTIDAGVGATGIAIANGKVYVTNTAFDGVNWTYGRGTVTVVDGASGDVVTTINVATNPQAAAVAPDGMLHVSCTGNYDDVMGKVSIINPATDAVTETVEIGGSPGSMSISFPDNLGYLAVWGAGLLVYNTETHDIVNGSDDYFLGKGGSGVLADTEGNVFVSVWDDDQVIKLDKDENILATYNVGDSPSALASKVE
jgi:streptogramin lyase